MSKNATLINLAKKSGMILPLSTVILVCFIIFLYIVMMSKMAFAYDSSVDQINVTIPISCTLSG